MNPVPRSPLSPLPYLSRRSFLGLGAAATGAVLIGACSTGDTGTQVTSTPRDGGRLRAVFAGGGAQEVLDPHKTNLYADVARSNALYDKLVEYGDDLGPVPRLATAWRPNADATTWTVQLRPAVFHDGRPVRAADVLYSYQRILDPKNALRPRASLEVIDIARSRQVDDRSIEFVCTRPCGDLANVLAAFGAYIIPEGTTDFTAPIGSGPFTFVSFAPGRSFVAARFGDYWDGPPHVEQLEILTAPDETARINALLGGQVEYADDLGVTSARTYETDARVQILRSPRSAMSGFAMKVDRPPFDNLDLRRAMFALTDRDELVSTVLGSTGVVGNDLFGKDTKYYATDLPQRSLDLDDAKTLIRKAGAQNTTIELQTTGATNGFVEAANILAEQAARAGLTIDVKVGEGSTYWTRTLDEGVLSSFRSGAMPIETHLAQRMLSTSSKNYTQWRRPDFDALFATASETTDEAVRARAYRDMQSQLYTEGGLLVWGFSDGLHGLAPNLAGMARSAPSNTLGYARFDKAWLS
ncbi:ABC transporter substrate-binding protein [Rhodococcus opacus]|uniref:Putative ABC transporter substrate-binding protein n=1 Tax=Rhodococcus opacus (strain B4) TaxID=632772 RepID=C1ARK3_RHOOB|nr:ABC transporter substrate-binding protein [Rhodococcus opacus]BAH48680.1 putative ABC transporter substrate-binding protein [Rhodococcus opacus B4]